MPADDQGGARPPPVVLRIKLRYDDVETMVQRFAPNVGKSGLFLPTKSLQPVGTEIKFELRIANDTPVLVGLGRVKAVKAPDPANPRAAFGLAIELMRVTREGREVIIRMIERRRAIGLADVAIPMPEDIESAKRADVETQPRVEVAAVAMPKPPIPDSAPILSAPPPIATPLARSVAPPPKFTPIVTAPIPAEGAAVTSFTSARRSSGSVPAVRSTDRPSAPVLAPEPVRAKRRGLADVIAQAERSGPMMATAIDPDLDLQIDLDRAMARARTIAAEGAAGDLDAELAALRENAAAPLAEISIEAASAELARQLGGISVSKRMRGVALGTAEAPMVTPPPSFASPVVEAPVAETLIDQAIEGDEPRAYERPVTSSSEMDQLAAEAAAGIVIAAHGSSGVVAIERPREPEPELESEPAPRPRTGTAPPAVIVEDDAELSSFARALDDARVHTGVETPAAPDDGVAEIDPDEIEELDHTQVGHNPELIAAPPIQLADSLDRHLDQAEAENDELQRAIQAAASEFEAELAQLPEEQAEHEPEPQDEVEEEISDLDVLAEADADDADLMAAHGERESQDAAPAYVQPADPYTHDHPAADQVAESAAYSAHDPLAFAEHDRAYEAGHGDPAQDPIAYEHGYTGPQQYTPPRQSDYAQESETYAADPDAYAAYASVAPTYSAPEALYTAQDERGYDSRGRAASESYEDPQSAYDPAYAAEAAYAEQVAREADPVTRPAEVPLPPALYSRRAATPEDEEFDFADQLDLDDESGTRPPAPYPGGYDIPSEFTLAEHLPTRAPSFAEQYPFPETPGLDEALEFDEPHQFATDTPAPPMPRSPAGTRQRPPSHQRMASRGASPRADSAPPYRQSEDSIDFDEPHGFVGAGEDASRDSMDSLESALSTLDVDLDRLVPPQQPLRARQPRAERASERGSRPLPGMPPERDPERPRTTGRNVVAKPAVPRPGPIAKVPPRPAGRTAAPLIPKPRAISEDDGVLIDFDDDE